MRTTKKEFKEQIQEHILNRLSTDETENPKEQIQNVIAEFHNWYSPYEQKHTPNCQEAFSNWLNCLPSGINLEWTYRGVNKTLKSWFENMGETYKDRDTDKEAILYHHLVYREFNTLAKKNDLKLF